MTLERRSAVYWPMSIAVLSAFLSPFGSRKGMLASGAQ
jgi:hypothetical protein